MKIAVCVSGQIRSWEKTYENWLLFFDMIKNHPHFIDDDVEIDLFIHTWNIKTIPPHMYINSGIFKDVRFENLIINVSEDEIDDMVDKLSPKHWVRDYYDINATRKYIINNLSKKNGNGQSIIDWAAPQLYSIMRSGESKLAYEINYDRQYDVCMKFRFDLMFNEQDMDIIINTIIKPLEERTIYSMHSKNIEQYPYEIVGDIFFISDSDTYNILSSFYNWLPTLKSDIFVYGKMINNELITGMSIEQIFAYYLRTFNVKNNRLLNLNVQIIREDYDFLKKRII